jgi:membrane protease YdiL (CAAX protease family)
MSNNILQKHSLASFFIITFFLTWGLCAYLLATTPPDVLQNISPKFIIIAILCGLSPTVTSCILSILKGEFKGLLKQVKTGPALWRFMVMTIALVPLTTFFSYLLSQKLNVHIRQADLMLGLIWPLFSSLGEEFGWRGFALPRLLASRGFLFASLSIGLIWGMWHLPMDYIGLRSHGWLFIPEFLLVGPGILTAHSVIMTWIYVRSNNNLLLMIIYHYTITASAIILPGLFTQNSIVGFSTLMQPLIANIILWIPALLILFRHRQLVSIKQKETNALFSQNSAT